MPTSAATPQKQSAPEGVPGVVRGKSIVLDAPLPALDGRRVRVVVELADETSVELTPQEQEMLWKEWAVSGPKGPLEIDAEDASMTRNS